MSGTDWIVVGADAVVYQALGHGVTDSASIRRTKIVKVGKRDVLTESGDKFNLNNTERWSGDARGLSLSLGTWSNPRLLLPPGDPRIARAEAAGERLQRARHCRNLIDAALDALRVDDDALAAEKLTEAAGSLTVRQDTE